MTAWGAGAGNPISPGHYRAVGPQLAFDV